MSQVPYRATAISRAGIRRIAKQVRQHVKFEDKPYFPIVEVVEFLLPRFVPGFVFEIGTKAEMDNNHGLTDPFEKTLTIREDVYAGACEGKGRDRGTVAHEFGHALLHSPARLARRMADTDIKPYRDPEWQAKAFHGELLVYHALVDGCQDEIEVAARFGVSTACAEFQMKIYRKDGII